MQTRSVEIVWSAEGRQVFLLSLQSRLRLMEKNISICYKTVGQHQIQDLRPSLKAPCVTKLPPCSTRAHINIKPSLLKLKNSLLWSIIEFQGLFWDENFLTLHFNKLCDDRKPKMPLVLCLNNSCLTVIIWPLLNCCILALGSRCCTQSCLFCTLRERERVGTKPFQMR